MNFIKFSLCLYKARLCCAHVLGTVQAKRTHSARQAAVALTAAIMVSSLSCKKDNSVLSVTPSVTDIVFSADGATATADSKDIRDGSIMVNTNQKSWDVTVSNNTWLKVTKWSTKTFRMTAQPNTSLTPPAPAEITVTAGDAPPVKIRVQQLGAIVPVTLSVTPEHRKIHFSFEGKMAVTQNNNIFMPPVFFVDTNEDRWDVASDQEWLTATKQGNNEFILTASVNKNDLPPVEATVTVTGVKAQPIRITVTQDGAGVWVTDEKMPIMAWWSIPESETSLARFKELADAGFTHNWMIYHSQDELQKALDVAHTVGVKMIPYYSRMESEIVTVVYRFRDHPALWAWSLMDEPYPKDFPYCASLSRKIMAYDGGKNFVYVNLLPIDKDTAVYRGYVRGAIEQIPNQKFISYDNYPVNGSPGNYWLYPLWEENYRIVAEEAKRAGMPFWAFICSVKWASAQPIPTLHTMRWYAYTALAYGSQGIQYFTYTNYDQPDWTHAPFDFYTQQKTATYYLAQEMNKEIQNFAKVFLNARVLEVRHTGTPNDAYQLKKAPAVFKTFETGSSGALTSLLEKDYRMFFVVVNRSVNQNLQVKVEVDNIVRQVTKNGTLKALTGLQTENLTPGDVLIYTWTR